MTGIVTELNAKIKNVFIGPFWNTISPDNSLRLYVEFLRKIDINKTAGLKAGTFPSKVIFGISPKLYKKIYSKKDSIRYQLKNDLLRLYVSSGCPVEVCDVAIDFIRLSYLHNSEVRVFIHQQNEKNTGAGNYCFQPIGDSEQKWTFQKPGIYFIGRDRKADICFNNPYISSRQAKVEFTKNGLLYITDCRSTNKTFINDTNEPLKARAVLSAGDKVYFGRNKKVGLEILQY